MKRNVFFLLLVLFSSSLFSQERTLKTRLLTYENLNQEQKRKVDNDSLSFRDFPVSNDFVISRVLLLKDHEGGSDTKLLSAYTGECSDFELELSEKDLMEYCCLQFVSFGYISQKIKISDIVNDSLLVVLKENKASRLKEALVAKPAIYLYPTKELKVEVKHQFKGKIHTTFPEYNEGWNVVASPNGKILNSEDGIKYNYLFWDGFYAFPKSHYNYRSGFYVKKEQAVKFLQESLSHVGLNQDEINDFIVYWLPELNMNELNFIHFRINDNIGNSSQLSVIPMPDTMIRLFMEFRACNADELRLPKQELPRFERKGFVLLEWGGAKIDLGKVE